jgi:hypothetical protein
MIWIEASSGIFSALSSSVVDPPLFNSNFSTRDVSLASKGSHTWTVPITRSTASGSVLHHQKEWAVLRGCVIKATIWIANQCSYAGHNIIVFGQLFAGRISQLKHCVEVRDSKLRG